MRFFVGLHQPSDAQHIDQAFISVNSLAKRKSDFHPSRWILDSGAFSQIESNGEFIMSVDEYADQIHRWKSCGVMERAVSQDYMCEPWILEKTGKTIPEHQEMTLDRFVRLNELCPGIVMPVLQGYAPSDYAEHIRMYGPLLRFGMWVGVGSVCKRNSHPSSVLAVLRAIRSERPDLNLHGFGLKTSTLRLAAVRDILYSADSMAWSYAARYSGRNGNDYREAIRFATEIQGQRVQEQLI